MAPTAPRPAHPLVIDTDPGIDDLVALGLAARDPRLAAVTTTYGNAALHHTTRNASHALALLGRGDVPVYPGAARPLNRAWEPTPSVHGPEGIGYATAPPAEPIRPSPTAVIDALERVGKPVVLLTLGPLTNLALALDTNAAAVRAGVAVHLGMFGTFGERGAPDRIADFNAWADPEALRAVLDAHLPTRMIGLDVTRRLVLSSDAAPEPASDDPFLAWVSGAVRFSVDYCRERRALNGWIPNDALVAVEAMRPGTVQFRDMPVTVDLDESNRRGHTKVAADGTSVAVATAVDVPSALSLVRGLLETEQDHAPHDDRGGE